MIGSRIGALAFVVALGAPCVAVAVESLPWVPEGARAVGGFAGGVPRVEARLLVRPAPPAPAAPGPLRVGVLFEIAPGWHLYWRNPGQSGLPTRLDWQVEGARIDATLWPAPVVFADPDTSLSSYGYEGRVLLMADARLDAADAGPRIARVEADLLLCETSCVPARLSLVRELGLGEVEDAGVTRRLFEEFEARLPLPAAAARVAVEASYSQSAIRPGDRFEAALLLPAGGVAEFFPYAIDGIALEVPRVERGIGGEPGTRVSLVARAGASDPGADQRLAGVLELRGGASAPRFVEVDLPLPRARTGSAVTQRDDSRGASAKAAVLVPELALWNALLLALLGGLILNLMPCVLPVLAIKVVSIAELAHGGRREAIAQGVAYTAGIVATMLALASCVALLRAAGQSVGWGFQFQHPGFLVAISTVLVVFACNLFGVFEVDVNTGGLARLGERATGARRSFFDGLLAAVLATPCSAPFLGTAVGFAFASSSGVIYATFGAIGMGLASPFLLVTLVPGLARLLPRPGAWMLALRTTLGFALLATVVWLLWILGRAAGLESLVLALAMLTAVAFACWICGLAQRAGRDRLKLGAFGAVLVLAISGLGAVSAAPLRPDAHAAGSPIPVFDRAAVARELDQGRAAFAYFTADWCITCAANERLVLADPSVARELARLNVATFRADWTLRDEGIRAELARYGRAGVPMYLVFSPKAPQQPKLLPELLSVELLIEALREATPGA